MKQTGVNQQKKRKRRSRPVRSPSNGTNNDEKDTGDRFIDPKKQRENEINSVVKSLMEAFGSVSLEEATAAINEANGDPDKAAEILVDFVDTSDDPCTNSVSSRSSGLEFGSTSGSGSGPGSSSSSSEGLIETGYLQNGVSMKGLWSNKQKKVVAATGTVSTVLGKEYLKPTSLRKETNTSPYKEFRVKGSKASDKEEVERFVYSMLGDDCELSMAVVQDVLGQCGYNVDKALDMMLDLSASSSEQNDNFGDRSSDSMSNLSESEFLDDFWSKSYNDRNYLKVLTTSVAPSPTIPKSNESDLPQKVLESLFHVPQSTKHESSDMNWKNVVKKLQSLGCGHDVSVRETQHNTYGKDDEYNMLRKTATQHWDATRSYKQRAATAYSKGERGYAAYLSEQGRKETKLARVADEKASQDIFKSRNRDIENVITIDLHGQRVEEAMKRLKVLLLVGSYFSSMRSLRVITGCGSHGLGKSKVKQSVISLLGKEGIQWSEENQGTVLIKHDGRTEFGFISADNDDDTE